MVIYVVERGDSLYSIGRRYGVSVDTLRTANQLLPTQPLVIGQALVIPKDMLTHQVAAGETLYTIARTYGTTVDGLLALNPSISNPSMIYPSQVLNVPAGAEPSRAVVVNGYCYPTIKQATLDMTLPNLTFLSPFSYMCTIDGGLIPIDDARLIASAYRQNVAPMMVITNTRPTGGFDTELSNTLLNNMQVQETLLDNIADTLNEKDYYGLNIDFEYISPNNREAYNAFLERVVRRFRPLGYVLATAVAPKTEVGQIGLLYEAHDYAAHGRLMDYVIIMTYEWGYMYGPPMAVSPVNQVEAVIKYAVSAIPSEKILMGMPNYGYIWTLPYQRGTAATNISNVSAVRIAAENGTNIEFDLKSQAPFFRYYTDGIQHEVWFQDARSVQAQLKLVDKYDLGGISYWLINTYFSQGWLVFNSMYNVEKRF